MYGMAAKPRIHLITPARSTYHPVNEHGDVHLPPLALFIRLGYICGKPIKKHGYEYPCLYRHLLSALGRGQGGVDFIFRLLGNLDDVTPDLFHFIVVV